MDVVIQCLKGLRDPRMDDLLKKIESQFVDIHFLGMSFNPIPIQVGYVDEEANGWGKPS